MEALRRLRLRRRACAITIRSIAFADRLRQRSSEFIADAWEPFEALGDELATLASVERASERERRALVAGLESGLRRVGLTETVQVHVLSRIAPRIMTGLPITRDRDPMQRLAV
jgi:hypothetical protein